MKQRRAVSLQEKRGRYGYVFLAPLLFGLIFLFGIPIIRSLIFSFSAVGSEDGLVPRFIGLKNFHDALFADTEYRQVVVLSVGNMLLNLPLIIIFSFFVANLLNQKFFGRTVVRVIFFLPIVLASSALLTFDASDILQNTMGAANGGFKQSESVMGGSGSIDMFLILMQSGLPSEVADYIMTAASRIYDIIVLSGVQILIFLAGLQSIPRSVYEASSIEGATGWETFWKITFPMISPLILTCSVYTIIDSFTSSTNKTISMIQDKMTNIQFGLSAAMSWIYFAVVGVCIAIVFFALSKWVYYSDK